MTTERQPSPAPWLPRLPDHWSAARLGRVVRIRNGRDYKDVEVSEGGYPVFGSGGEFRRASEFLFDGPSVLFGRKGTIDRPVLVCGRFWTVDTMFYTEIGPKIEPRFLSYVSKTLPFSYYSTDTALPSMTQGDLASFVVPLPPKSEQRAIADFLDRETAQIDTLIAKQERLIGTLRERRTALAADPLMHIDAAHMTTLKRIASIQTGVTLSGEGNPRDPEWPYLRVANVQVGHVDLGRITTLRLPESEAMQSMLQPGDVLLTEGGDIDKLGRGALWQGQLAQILHQNHVFAVRASDRLDPRYLVYWLDGPEARYYFRTTARKTTNLASTNKWTLGNLPVACPGLDEQAKIVNVLDEQTTRVDSLIAKAEEFIALAKERRAAVITAAVTGQIDVASAA